MRRVLLLLTAAVVLFSLTRCGAALPPTVSRGIGREQLIKLFFEEGYGYRSILCFLNFVHGFILSLRQLKRILKKHNLKKWPGNRGVNIRTIIQLIKVLIRIIDCQILTDALPECGLYGYIISLSSYMLHPK